MKRTNFSGEPKGKRAKPARPYVPKPKAEELNGYDTKLTLTQGQVLATVTTNGSAFCLNLPVTGDETVNRHGRNIRCKSVRLTGIAQHIQDADGTGNLLDNTIRMVVVWDKTPGGAGIPAFDEIFGERDQSNALTTSFMDPVQFSQMARFQVLRDVVINHHPIEDNSAGGTILNGYKFDEYIKLGRDTQFGATTGAATDINSGGLYVYFRALRNTSGDAQWLIDSVSHARLRFYA